MSSEPADPPADSGNVVPLHAVDAHTEVRLDQAEAAAPSYVDLTTGDAQRRPIIPEHWRTWEHARRHISLAAARHGHRAAYHGVRSPAYFAKALAFAVWGVIVTIKRLITWWHIPGTTRLEWEAAANGLLNDHLRLHRAGKETRRARGTILALCLAGLAAAAVAMARFAPWWAWLLIALVLFAAFALAGRPQGKSITSRAEIPAQVQPPTQDVIIRALGSLGIAEINRAVASGSFPPLPAPVREDGPGWRAEIDLPYGVTAGMVIDRREQFASGLRRPLGAVWPEPASHEHAGPARAVGRPRRHQQGQAAAVAAAAVRAVRRVRRAAVRRRRPRSYRQGPGDLPQLADRVDSPAGQDLGRTRAELRQRPGSAGGEVDARAQGLRRPGPDGADLPPVRLRHR